MLLFVRAISKSNMATPVSDWLRNILLFIPETISFEVTKLAIDVSLRALKKCCYSLKLFKIQDGHPSFWLVENIFDFFYRKYCMLSHQTFIWIESHNIWYNMSGLIHILRNIVLILEHFIYSNTCTHVIWTTSSRYIHTSASLMTKLG